MAKRRRSHADLFGDDPPPKNKGGRPVEAHRVRLATAQAQLAEIRAAKMRGELVPAADVLAEWRGILADLRQRLLAVSGRIDAPREIVAKVDREIRAALLAASTLEGDSNAADV